VVPVIAFLKRSQTDWTVSQRLRSGVPLGRHSRLGAGDESEAEQFCRRSGNQQSVWALVDHCFLW